jgi:hypothetical protein
MRPRIKVRLKAIAKRYVSFNFASGFALWIETPRRNSWRMKKINTVENKLELHERIDLLCAHRGRQGARAFVNNAMIRLFPQTLFGPRGIRLLKSGLRPCGILDGTEDKKKNEMNGSNRRFAVAPMMDGTAQRELGQQNKDRLQVTTGASHTRSHTATRCAEVARTPCVLHRLACRDTQQDR